MPNPLNNVQWEEWDNCARCGYAYPISQLLRQKGLLVCMKDRDNLDIERRQQEIQRILSDGKENVSTRAEQLGQQEGELTFGGSPAIDSKQPSGYGEGGYGEGTFGGGSI